MEEIRIRRQLSAAPSVRCTSFGSAFVLSAESNSLLESMVRVAPLGTVVETDHASTANDSAPRFALVRRLPGGYSICRGHSIGEAAELHLALAELSRDLMMHVANHAPDRVFVHAGVVAKSGLALLLPGLSFSGKTTLVAELVRAGALYYSDEYAVLDAEARVHPFPRDLMMRQPGTPEQTALPVEALHGVAGVDPLPVAQVVFSQYVPTASWLPTPVSPGMAVLEMLRHTIPVQRTPTRVMAVLARVMQTASAWRSMRGDAKQAAQALLALLDAPAVAA
jgi:hypothetical protein